jgi:sensor histidine kinase YesM
MIHPFQIYNKSSAIFISFWLIIILMQIAVLNLVFQVDIYLSVIDSLIYNIIYAVISYSLWYFISAYGTEKKITSLIFTNLFVSIIIAAFWLFVSNFLLEVFVYNKENLSYQELNNKSLLIRGIVGIFHYGMIISAYYVYIIYQNLTTKKIREQELNKLLTESELKTLKYQINPHFIFNTLNSISSLTLISPEKAREMTIRLSDFMRSTFAKKDDKFILLKDELSSIKNYLEIEKIRFEDKFEYQENVSTFCMNKKIPNFLIQPIIENAIKHGVYESLNKVKIQLNCNQKESFTEITITNNYEERSKKGEGVGITNVNERLKLIYGNDRLLKIEDENNIFSVTIYIPHEFEND